MPHSYGASFSGVGFFLPVRFDRPMFSAPKPAPSTIMMRMGTHPCMAVVGRTRGTSSNGLRRLFDRGMLSRRGTNVGNTTTPGVGQFEGISLPQSQIPNPQSVNPQSRIPKPQSRILSPGLWIEDCGLRIGGLGNGDRGLRIGRD